MCRFSHDVVPSYIHYIHSLPSCSDWESTLPMCSCGRANPCPRAALPCSGDNHEFSIEFVRVSYFWVPSGTLEYPFTWFRRPHFPDYPPDSYDTFNLTLLLRPVPIGFTTSANRIPAIKDTSLLDLSNTATFAEYGDAHLGSVILENSTYYHAFCLDRVFFRLETPSELVNQTVKGILFCARTGASSITTY